MTLDATALRAHRPLLLTHCYRMLGSSVDAEDAVQETLLRAVRAAEGFEGRSSLRRWLTSIATNVCIDALRVRARRERPVDRPPGTPADPITFGDPDGWVEPMPGAWLPRSDDPAERVSQRQSVQLAFVTALQHLPPTQRAALLLTQVLGWTAKEVAEGLDTSVPAVNSALQRARATLKTREPSPEPVAPDHAAAQRYVEAFVRYDLDALVQLLTDDVRFDMPPIPLWVQGPDHVRSFLAGPGAECEGSVAVPLEVNGAPGFAQYRHGGATPWGIVRLVPRGDRIAEITTFLDVERLFPIFGLPPTWTSDTASQGAPFFSATDESRGAASS